MGGKKNGGWNSWLSVILNIEGILISYNLEKQWDCDNNKLKYSICLEE